jgi:small subunit ribosomal protein S3
MGQKTNPIGFRLGVIRTWSSRWYEEKKYAEWLKSDFEIRSFLKKKYYEQKIARIEIDRREGKVKVTIHTAAPSEFVANSHEKYASIKKEIDRMTGCQTHLVIEDIRKPELDAVLVAENIASQLERRVAFRRAMKRAMQLTMKTDKSGKTAAQGIRVSATGRLGGAEMSRYEWYREGRVPLHTLRADIDYGTAIAKTTYGIIGIKCWIFKDEVYNQAGSSAR